MKIAAYGTIAPDLLMYQLHKQGVDIDVELLVTPCKGLLPSRLNPKCTYLLFLSTQDLRNNIYHNPDLLKNRICVVFDDLVTLVQFNVTPMDYFLGEVCNNGVITIDPSYVFDDLPDTDMSKTKVSLIELAVGEVKSMQTILNQLMTFIYSLSSRTHQKPVKKIVCAWFVSNQTVNTLIQKLSNDRNLPMSPKQLVRLETILSSDVAKLYKQALQEKDVSSTELSKKYVISSYELNYVRAINAQKG